jgi:lectin, mannose-binding 1
MHQSVDSIAFGHCSYSYRNLGRPSRIAITQTADTFRVNVDGNICFESDKVKIPLGYNFGISAASAENPDSFEVFKLVTTTESHTPDVVDPNAEQQQQDQQRWMANSDPKSPNYNIRRGREPPQPNNPGTGDIPSFSSDPPEVPAASIQNSNEQFADLHNRLQAMMKHISALNRDFINFQTNSATRHAELIKTISNLEAAFNRLNDINAKLGEIQADVRQTKQDLHNSLDRHISGLKNEVRSGHSTVMGTIAGLGTGVGKFVLVVVGSQALTVGAYLLYKRRKANSPKKYL